MTVVPAPQSPIVAPPDAIRKLILTGELQIKGAEKDALDAKDEAMQHLQDSALRLLPEAVHPYILWHERTFTERDTEHVIGVRAPGLCEVRTLLARDVGSPTWRMRGWSSTLDSRPPHHPRLEHWAVLARPDAPRSSWSYAPNLEHALYLARKLYLVMTRLGATDTEKAPQGVPATLGLAPQVGRFIIPPAVSPEAMLQALAALLRIEALLQTSLERLIHLGNVLTPTPTPTPAKKPAPAHNGQRHPGVEDMIVGDLAVLAQQDDAA